MSVRGESREAGRRNLGGVLFELHQHLVDISVGRELDHDFELLHLHLPVDGEKWNVEAEGGGRGWRRLTGRARRGSRRSGRCTCRRTP